MSRVSILVFLAAAALVHASRDEESKKTGDVEVSVGTRNFQRSASEKIQEQRHAREEPALTQLRQKLREESKMQPEDKPSAKAATASQSGLHQAAEVSSGMNRLHDRSVELRKAVEDLGLGSGLNDSAEKAASTEQAKVESKLDEDAKQKLRAMFDQVAQQRQSVTAWADDLDRRIHQQYDLIQGSSPVEPVFGMGAHPQNSEPALANNLVDMESLVSLGQQFDLDKAKMTESEAQQFAKLQQQHTGVKQWFEEFKNLHEAIEQMKKNKGNAVKAAQQLGLSSEEVQRELAKPPPTTSSSAVQTSSTPDQRRQLADVMASSAIEMAQIESAANDVMKGLDDFAKWKQRDDKSPAALAEAAKVKAKLDKALKFLQEHEDLVNDRTNQIDTLMRQNGMGPL